MSLAVQELNRLNELEGVVRSGLQTFVEVGLALKEIRDSRLYRAEFNTFESYCRERWGWGRNYANQLVASASAAERVAAIAATKRTIKESHVRPLRKLPVEQQAKAWERAVEISGGNVTAKHVQAAVEEVKAAPSNVTLTGKRFPRMKNSSQIVESLLNKLGAIPQILEHVEVSNIPKTERREFATEMRAVRKKLTRLIRELEEA